MSLTVSTFAVALCATKILSAYANLQIANLSPEILPSPLALIQNEFATLRGKTTIRNSIPSSPALQTVKGLDGYMIVENFPDKTCASSDYSVSRVLNTCIGGSGSYEFISATATVANITHYTDSACTIPLTGTKENLEKICLTYQLTIALIILLARGITKSIMVRQVT
jgi:hypothetical protein